MKIRTRLAILAAAVMISLTGFNLISGVLSVDNVMTAFMPRLHYFITVIG
jgi:4-amino-4-deoxy-L-arabinose transferase-like glycosyltransferase